MPGRVVSIIGKGGTGKTTTTSTLGALYAADGAQVAMVDMDSTPTLTAWVLPGQRITRSIADVLTGELTVDAVTHEVRERLEVVPGAPELARLEATVDPRRVHDALTDLRSRADIVLLDLRGGVASRMAAVAVAASELAVVPIECGPADLESLKLTRELLGELETTLAGVVPTQHNGRSVVERQLIRALEAAGFPVWPSIRRDVAAKEAPGSGELLDIYAPSSRALSDYAEIADRLANALSVAAV